MTLPSFSASASTLPQLNNPSLAVSANQSTNDINNYPTPTLIPPSRATTTTNKSTIFDNSVPLARSSPAPSNKPAPPPRSTTDAIPAPISSVCLYSLFLFKGLLFGYHSVTLLNLGFFKKLFSLENV